MNLSGKTGTNHLVIKLESRKSHTLRIFDFNCNSHFTFHNLQFTK